MQKSKKLNEISTDQMEYKIQKWLIFISIVIMCTSIAVLPFIFPSEDLDLQRFNIQTLFTATSDLEVASQDHGKRIIELSKEIKELKSIITDRKLPKQ